MKVDHPRYTKDYNYLFTATVKGLSHLSDTERKSTIKALASIGELVHLSADIQAIKEAEGLSRERVIELHLDQCTKLILLLRSCNVSQKEIIRQLNSDIWILSDVFEEWKSQEKSNSSPHKQGKGELLDLEIKATSSPPIETWKLHSIISNNKLTDPKLKRFVIKWLAARRWVEKRLKKNLLQWEAK